MPLQSFKDLNVWQESMKLTQTVYKITGQLPNSETFGLISQMRRASVSIPSNIAEGYKRKNRAEYLHFLRIADASAAELETQLIILKSAYSQIDAQNLEELLVATQKMLYRLIQSLSTPYPIPHTPNPKPSSQ